MNVSLSLVVIHLLLSVWQQLSVSLIWYLVGAHSHRISLDNGVHYAYTCNMHNVTPGINSLLFARLRIKHD
ncbi:MAG: hypothetical protein GQ546_14855 [Gammaproteobacteria bacterium]|nr:hypothetical protein [Gammaproteobacteria bacterium]